ncbi:DUF433 domain-containing protein [Iningainema tapete]|uniref:DUF433 domain-containing protein n=1 Tax=Iningainema tapete BLCC-T55 TaxID=2748662 RepID=A0A8J6XEQ4_9CYAN|nr:DUF433 domain-containing protein [Iningainema tapete]MBD2771222.1 DUF433 domain-containing protein [Iningainema tapete BLCC-T55]
MITIVQSPISSDPEVMGCTLVFRNTRVPAQSLLEYLDDGFSLEEFLDNFPSVNRADAVTFLKLACEELHYGVQCEEQPEFCYTGAYK